MKADESAVGGFFEDLPVLAFVLAGVALLMSTGVYVSQRLDEARSEEEADALAESLLLEVLGKLRNQESSGVMPTVASVVGADLAVSLNRVTGCTVSVVMRHPNVEWLRVESFGVFEQSRTGYASALMNAIDDDGIVVILEVRVVAW